MRVVGALTMASALPILLLAPLGHIETGPALGLAIIAVVLGVLIVIGDAL